MASTRLALSFEPERLTAADFDADRLTEELRVRVPLQTLRADLSAHLQELQATLVDLINSDYNDLVSMSTSLVGIDEKIARLEMPIGHLKQQFEGSREESSSHLMNLRKLMGERDDVSARRAQLQVFVQIADSLANVQRLWQNADHDLSSTTGTADHASHTASQDTSAAGPSAPVNLERVAGELRVLSSVCKGVSRRCAFIEQSRSHIDAHHAKLMGEAGLCLSRGIDAMDAETVKSALQVYAIVGQHTASHQLFKEKYVRPALAEAAARVKQDDDDTQATAGLYTAAGDFLRSHSTAMLLAAATDLNDAAVRQHTSTHTQLFDFVADSIWTEVYSVIQEVIFRPASEDFHRNYRLSMQFVDLLESTYRTKHTLQMFREHASTVGLLGKWELHGKTYFQLHRNEVVLHVEEALSAVSKSGSEVAAVANDAETDNAVADNVNSQRTPGAAISQLVLQMWDPEVFLPSQASDFLRLTLDLVAKYRVWLRAYFCKDEAGYVGIPLATRVLATVEAQEFKEEIKKAEVLIAARLSEDPPSKDIASAAMADVSLELFAALQDLENSTTASAAHVCCEVLRGASGVKQVLAMYRMTDRPAPTEPLAYVGESLVALSCYARDTEASVRLSEDDADRLVRASLSLICECYVTLCIEVIESARKTAAGLGLIKTRRKKAVGNQSDSAAPLSDTEKISAQLHIDTKHFGVLCTRDYNVQPESIQAFHKLLELTSEKREEEH